MWPTALMKTFEMIGNCATPLCLILFGCSMRDLWHNMKWEPKPIICGLLTRLGLAPALLLLMAYFLPVDDYIKRVIITRQPFLRRLRSSCQTVSEAIRTWALKSC